jgi:L-aminopeptidase/D-esterase-like protein
MSGSELWALGFGLWRRPAGLAAVSLVVALADSAAAQTVRARELGIPFDGTPGPLNAITDVAGVEVGHVTLTEGSGRLVVGRGPVRTGVTAILPRGRSGPDTAFAATFSLNGNGEMTGAAWIEESGQLEGPILITNTHSVGVVRDAVIGWQIESRPGFLWALPVVAETYDGILNDINGFHVTAQHARDAILAARGGAVAEGAVGGGTGMICNGFKGGIGTSSRRLPERGGGWTVGVLVQCNYGSQSSVLIGGIPVGRRLLEDGFHGMCRGELDPTLDFLDGLPHCEGAGAFDPDMHGDDPRAPTSPLHDLGSIIIVIATDAPVLPHQLERLATRATLGLGRLGSISGNGSGDLFIAFSIANTGLGVELGAVPVRMLGNENMNWLFSAVVQATEEAVLNAMVAAETMTGVDDVTVRALPHERVRAVLRAHDRLAQ